MAITPALPYQTSGKVMSLRERASYATAGAKLIPEKYGLFTLFFARKSGHCFNVVSAYYDTAHRGNTIRRCLSSPEKVRRTFSVE